MSIWILNCFFVSASNQPWLRSMFPIVQSRIRMSEIEDRQLLCISAANFYKQVQKIYFYLSYYLKFLYFVFYFSIFCF